MQKTVQEIAAELYAAWNTSAQYAQTFYAEI